LRHLSIQLAPRYTPLCRSSEQLVLSAEDEVLCIQDPIVADIVVALASCRSTEEIEHSLSSRYPAREVRSAIERMTAQRLVQAASDCSPAVAAYWDSAGCDPPQGVIDFQPICNDGSELIRHALKMNGLDLSESAPYLLVTTDDYLRPELAKINLRQRSWLLAKPVGHTIWVGPLFTPGRTACWSCLAAWLKPQRSTQAAFYGWGDTDFPPQPSRAVLPTTLGCAAGMIATAVAVWVARGQYADLENVVCSFDTRSLRQSRNHLVPRPDCPNCGTLPRARRNFYSFVSPITSVVSRIDTTDAPVAGLFHTHAAFAPPLPRYQGHALLRRQHAIGKGLTAADAELTAIAESLERYSLIYQGGEASIHARINEVDAISPESVLLFSASQYQGRQAWNDSHSELHWVPERFDPSQAIEWTEAVSLISKRKKHVPSALCYMYYPFSNDNRFCAADTNGCASGRSRIEAIQAAMFELIERDAVALWWYNRVQRPALDLESLADAKLLELREAFGGLGRCLYVLDVTTDLAVPAYVAVAPKLDGSEPCFGTAADVSAPKAAFRAIAEAAQVCFWVATGDASGELLSWIKSASVNEQPYLRPAGNCTASRELFSSPEEALELCLQRVQAAGIEPFYVDLTRPEIGVPVARAIAPGLRHFWARLGPGRLYQTPVRLGWLARPLAEAEMNPVPCMI
jgi:bacteriocin biosynthesis cyclodehydratase domain-containing protein